MSESSLPDIFADLVPGSKARDSVNDDSVLPSIKSNDRVLSSPKRNQPGPPMVRYLRVLPVWITLPSALMGGQVTLRIPFRSFDRHSTRKASRSWTLRCRVSWAS